MVSVLCSRIFQQHLVTHVSRCSGLGMPSQLTVLAWPCLRSNVSSVPLCPKFYSESRAPRLCRSASSGLGDSSLDNEIVREEFTRLMNDWEQLLRMENRFVDFDVEGKRMFADRMEDVGERVNIFVTRLKWSSDPAGKALLTELQSKLVAQGWSSEALTAKLKVSVQGFRYLADQEEKCGSDPVKIAAFKELQTKSAKRAQEYTSNLMQDSAEKQKLEEALNDPEVVRLLQEVMQASDDATRFKLMSANPKLRALMEKVRMDMT